MDISFSSVFSSVFSMSLLICLLYLIIRKKNIVTHFGLGCLYVLLILILFRGFFPVDFYYIGLTTSVYSQKFLPWLRDLFLVEIFSLHKFTVTPFKLILTLWLIGSFFCAYRVIRNYLMASKVAKSSPQIANKATLHIFQSTLETIWATQRPNFQLVLNDYFDSPALFGIGKPILILPHLDYSEEELSLVFFHELLHYKHKDYIFKLLIDFLCVIYWWNPFITLLFSSLAVQIQELWVDYHISNTNNKTQRILYMQTLATTLRHSQPHSNPSNTDTSTILLTAEYKRSFIRQRFDYIKTNDIKSFTIYGIVLCLALFFFTYTIVFEPLYQPSVDEQGDPVFRDSEGKTYFIRNGANYDLYMDDTYVGTLDKIPKDFENAPIYNTKEEVP